MTLPQTEEEAVAAKLAWLAEKISAIALAHGLQVVGAVSVDLSGERRGAIGFQLTHTPFGAKRLALALRPMVKKAFDNAAREATRQHGSLPVN